jgi:hypothetical protein
VEAFLRLNHGRMALIPVPNCIARAQLAPGSFDPLGNQDSLSKDASTALPAGSRPDHPASRTPGKGRIRASSGGSGTNPRYDLVDGRSKEGTPVGQSK